MRLVGAAAKRRTVTCRFPTTLCAGELLMNVPDGALGPTADPVNSGIVAGEMDAENVTVTGNTVYGNSAAGIIARRGSKHIVIANNTVYNNSQHVAGAFSS